MRKAQRFRQAHHVVHANAIDENIGSRVIADGHHYRREIAIRERRYFRCEAAQDGAIGNDIRRAYHIAVRQCRLAAHAVRRLLRLMIKLREHRDLDGTRLRKYLVWTDQEFLSGVQVQDGNAHDAIEPLLHVGKRLPQVIPQHLLLGVEWRIRGVHPRRRK